MSPPLDGVNAQDRWPGRTASRTCSLCWSPQAWDGHDLAFLGCRVYTPLLVARIPGSWLVPHFSPARPQHCPHTCRRGDAWISQVWQCLGHHASPRSLGGAFNLWSARQLNTLGLRALLSATSFQHFYLGQPGYVALIRYPMRLSFGKCSCLSASCSAWIRGISWIPQCSWAGVHTLWYIPPPCPPLRVLILYTAPCLWLVSQARGWYSLWPCQATALPSHLLTGDSWTSQVWQCLGHHASPCLLGRAFNI